MSEEIKKGLLGIIVDETEVSKVMPEINSLTYRGYAAQDLCAKCKFEEVAYLILNAFLILASGEESVVSLSSSPITLTAVLATSIG